jgi:hypothetical protein
MPQVLLSHTPYPRMAESPLSSADHYLAILTQQGLGRNSYGI